MRKFLLNFLIFLSFCIPSVLPAILYAQDTTSVVVPRSMLTAEQTKLIQESNTLNDINRRIETYGKWAGVGNEIGIAVNGTLSAINQQTAAFAETRLGKVAIFLVVWKVIGEDIRDIMYSLFLLFIGIPVLLWRWHRFNNPITSITYNDKGKKVKQYGKPNLNSDGWFGVNAVFAVIFVALFVSAGITLTG